MPTPKYLSPPFFHLHTLNSASTRYTRKLYSIESMVLLLPPPPPPLSSSCTSKNSLPYNCFPPVPVLPHSFHFLSLLPSFFLLSLLNQRDYLLRLRNLSHWFLFLLSQILYLFSFFSLNPTFNIPLFASISPSPHGFTFSLCLTLLHHTLLIRTFSLSLASTSNFISFSCLPFSLLNSLLFHPQLHTFNSIFFLYLLYFYLFMFNSPSLTLLILFPRQFLLFIPPSLCKLYVSLYSHFFPLTFLFSA